MLTAPTATEFAAAVLATPTATAAVTALDDAPIEILDDDDVADLPMDTH